MEVNLYQTIEDIRVSVDDTTEDITVNVVTAENDSVAPHTHDYSTLTGVPLVFEPAPHIHPEYLTELPSDLETIQGSQTKANAAETAAKNYTDEKVKTPVPIGAVFTDTVYDDTLIQQEVEGKAEVNHTHPEYITEIPSNLETVDGAQAKANTAETNAIQFSTDRTPEIKVVTQAEHDALGDTSQDPIVYIIKDEV